MMKQLGSWVFKQNDSPLSTNLRAMVQKTELLITQNVLWRSRFWL